MGVDDVRTLPRGPAASGRRPTGSLVDAFDRTGRWTRRFDVQPVRLPDHRDGWRWEPYAVPPVKMTARLVVTWSKRAGFVPIDEPRPRRPASG